ncbi:hypothetical protein FHP29_13420 [Nocardioides albidus]|uniref:Uncharacterized protein n=1 Tax=Nocardioides albidus TaxID=1517589 RepID=A0A5C4VR01_9ACTN|nr:hypothetical protein [Nocardioides albidus]TNM38280.1 hypothetical protein FHP29_13420 [Nocardioides albidus]
MGARTPASWTAVALTAVLGLCQVYWALGEGSSSAGLMAPFSLLAALALARADCLEARLGVVVVAAAPLLLTALALTIGLPGQPRQPVGAGAVLGLAVPVAVLVALGLDRRERARARPAGPAPRSPYAR